MKHVMIRNSIIMAVVTVIIGIIIGLYIQGTGPMPRITATTYTSVQEGAFSEILVTVSVKSGKITSVSADVSGETAGYGLEAGPVVCQAVQDAGTCAGVDGVSGATKTSDAILAGVQDCMVQAGIWDSANSASAANAASAAAGSASSSAAQ